MKTTTHTIRQRKGNTPVVATTAYDAITARLASEAGVDMLLVGDSVGTTLLGFPSTIPVTLDMMAHHTAAVARACPEALIVTDIPFGEAHYEHARVLAACQRLMQQSGAEAVKIEGGVPLAPDIRRLVDAGVPVCGHIGLQPQQIANLGRYRRFGGASTEADELLADARALEQAGVFAIVLEMVDAEVARRITASVGVPTIGIGSGPHCDGQVLVSTDLLGLTPGPVPSFVRKFADLAPAFRSGFAAYAGAVRSRTFP